MKRIAQFFGFVLLLLFAGGCFNPFRPLISKQVGISSPAPVPTSPELAVRLHEWCWKNRAVEEYRELFTDDYQFVFAQSDSAGNQYRDVPLRREDELSIAQNMFVGGGDRQPASRIIVNYDNNLIPFPDTRPGMNSTWHKVIRTSVNLSVEVSDGSSYQVTGYTTFFLERGDSAVIPQELVTQGFKPDSSRWWIQRWQDETLSGTGGSLKPAPPPVALKPGARRTAGSLTDLTIGQLKGLWNH